MSGVRIVAAVDGSQEQRGKWPKSHATDADMATINAMPGVLEPLAASDVFVRGVYAINDMPLRGQYEGLFIDSSAVIDLAPMAYRTKVHCVHTTTPGRGKDALPVATLFRGDYAIEDGSTWARMWMYFAATDENAALVQMIDSGNIEEVSIGAGFKRSRCNICGADAGLLGHEHVATEKYNGKTCLYGLLEPTGLDELSLVGKGAAQGTHFFLSASAGEYDARRLIVRPEPAGLSHLYYKPRPLGALFGGGSPAP